MLIPIDERMATRAHAVFDVVYVKKLNIINLELHVSRLMKSSESVAIQSPVTHNEVIKIVEDVMSTLIKKFLQEGSSK